MRSHLPHHIAAAVCYGAEHQIDCALIGLRLAAMSTGRFDIGSGIEGNSIR